MAERLGVSRSELLRQALRAYINSARDKGTRDPADAESVREALDKIYAGKDSRVDERLAGMQWASLPKESW